MNKNEQYFVFFIVLAVASFFACKKKQSSFSLQGKEIVAVVDGEAIYSEELNSMIKQELFDELTRIYQIKKRNLEQLINIKILEKEAKTKGMSYQQYINYYTDSVIKKGKYNSLQKYYNANQKSANDKLHNNFSLVSSASENALELFQIKGAILDDLIYSLKKSRKIMRYIYPPLSPTLDLKNLNIHFRGNLQSKVTAIIISDFDCPICIQSYHLYDSIYNLYKDKVKFGYIHYSAIPTIAQVASEAAAKQGLFWEFYEKLYEYRGSLDQNAIMLIASGLDLDMGRFNHDIQFDNTIKDKIEETINKLVMNGVYATPTLIVNKKLIVNSDSGKEICNLIEIELDNC